MKIDKKWWKSTKNGENAENPKKFAEIYLRNLPLFACMWRSLQKNIQTLTGWKFNKSFVLVEHQLIFSSFYSRGLPPTPPAEEKRENWCSDNFHNLLGRFVIFTISKHLSHSCPRLWRNCWRLAVWDHVCLSALVDHRPELRFCEIDDTCIYC